MTVQPVQPLRRVGILGHPRRPETAGIVDQVAASLRAHNIDTWQQVEWHVEGVLPLVRESDMVIAIGGDGAMLRAGRLCGLEDVPVFGINFGHLGFLTETSPEEWPQAVDNLISGRYWIENRMMIRAELWRGSTLITRHEALNDALIGRGASGRLAILETYIDDGWATTYTCDGLIVATPTGSTAYALAVGGPILPPELKNILVLPIAAHLSLDRSLVLSEGAVVEVITRDIGANTQLTIDGESVAFLEEGDRILIQSSDFRSKFARLRDRNYFYRSLLDRLEPRVPYRKEPNGRLNHDHTRKTS